MKFQQQQRKTTKYGTKKTTKGANKGAQGQDLKNKKQVSAEKVETKVEGSKETDTEKLIEKDPESKKAYNEISQEVNRKEDEAKEAAARKEIPNSTTEVVETVNNGEKINIGITKDENTGSNKNTVKEDKKEEPVKELVSENGTTIDVNSVVDVPAQEKAPEVKAEENKKAEEKTTNGIASMFPEEAEEDSAKEFSKQTIVEKNEETTKAETEAPVVETKVVLPTTESTEEETAKVVAEEKKSVETKEAPKAEVVETTKEVKKEVKVTEEKAEEPAKVNATYADTVVAVSRDAKATFVVTSGKVVSVQNGDEQISVANNGSSIVVTNNFPEFDGTVSFTAVDEAGQSTTLTVIFK